MKDNSTSAVTGHMNKKQKCGNAPKKKKLLAAAALCVVLIICAMGGCGAGGGDTGGGTNKDDMAGKGGSDTIKVVAAIAPIYDWTKNVIGQNDIELTLLLDKGVDLHSYQPSAEDLNIISNCDLFIYVGGESDEWVGDALAQAANKDMRVISLMDILGDKAKEEEHKEGMQAARDEKAEEHDEKDGHGEKAGEEDTGEEKEYDEHVWLSVRNARLFTEKIAEELEKLDAPRADAYKRNAAAYTEKLKKLDSRYSKTIRDSRLKTLVFADRFPFRYMTDDYDLDYYAAFIGCSSESEASFDTMTFLADKLNGLEEKYVMTIDGSDQKLARSVIDIAETKDKSKEYKILTLDSMQSSSKEQMDSGNDYISVMKKDLRVLKQALE